LNPKVEVILHNGTLPWDSLCSVVDRLVSWNLFTSGLFGAGSDQNLGPESLAWPNVIRDCLSTEIRFVFAGEIRKRCPESEQARGEALASIVRTSFDFQAMDIRDNVFALRAVLPDSETSPAPSFQRMCMKSSLSITDGSSVEDEAMSCSRQLAHSRVIGQAQLARFLEVPSLVDA